MCINLKMKKSLLENKSGIVSLSWENKKLISTSETRFIIWSIPAIKTCPFATKHCAKDCYARKAEKCYPDCLSARTKNYDFSKTDMFVPFMVNVFHYMASLKAYREAKHISIRIHESGDFYSVEYLEKWLDIAEQCKDIPNIDFCAYTKSIPYLVQACKDGYNLNDCGIHFLSSIWDDTKKERIEETFELNLPIYTAFEKGHFPDGYTKCECNDCGHCRQCYKGENEKQMIAVEIH